MLRCQLKKKVNYFWCSLLCSLLIWFSCLNFCWFHQHIVIQTNFQTFQTNRQCNEKIGTLLFRTVTIRSVLTSFSSNNLKYWLLFVWIVFLFDTVFWFPLGQINWFGILFSCLFQFVSHGACVYFFFKPLRHMVSVAQIIHFPNNNQFTAISQLPHLTCISRLNEIICTATDSRLHFQR